MKAVVFHSVKDIRLDTVKDPKIKDSKDAIVKLTTSAICGTDLHLVRGTMGGMKSGTILGHEGVGVVEEAGSTVRNFRKGDRVLVPSTLACGYCSYCKSGHNAQCDNANPNGKEAGTAFFGGPETTGAIDGLQAEYARIPFAATTLIPLPHEVTDAQAILVSDIFPTGYFGAENAEIKPGDDVAVFGCGPVGLFTIASAKLLGARRIFAVDRIATRLEAARRLGAEIINFDAESPIEALKELTDGIGPNRVIDAVGVDANRPSGKSKKSEEGLPAEPTKEDWKPGDAPTQVLQWAVEGVAKAGTISIIGVYPPTAKEFPIGAAMNKNVSIKMGNCNHLRYASYLIHLVRSGAIDPTKVLTQVEPLTDAIEAYKHFDHRESGWIKVALNLSSAATA
jgi:threonine dehydrogenase-like Zn-dependent dehydrogenase